MQKYVRPKFKRPRKPKGFRSIPLRNPQVVAWHTYGSKGLLEGKRPRPVGGPTEDCFESDAQWYAINNAGKMVRITGEPEPKIGYVLIKTNIAHQELRLYSVGRTEYFFVLFNSHTYLKARSVSYHNRDSAIRAIDRGIRWLETEPWRPLRGGD